MCTAQVSNIGNMYMYLLYYLLYNRTLGRACLIGEENALRLELVSQYTTNQCRYRHLLITMILIPSMRHL